ncbi:MAG: type VI secretion system tube protein Hcp [Glaciimonas sp.]|nr:type VI secretion system tube protein Hcp [Glaciimonas sp.]
MAQDMFLKIAGIDGESNDSDHKNQIDVLQWDWKITQSSNMHSGSGGGAGKATISDLYFEHYADRASPNLMKYCLTGKHIAEAVMVNRKAGGNPLEYMRITMSDVIVTLVHPVSSGSDEHIREQVGLSFSRVKQEYIVQNALGGSAGAVTASYDIKANREQ